MGGTGVYITADEVFLSMRKPRARGVEKVGDVGLEGDTLVTELAHGGGGALDYKRLVVTVVPFRSRQGRRVADLDCVRVWESQGRRRSEA